MSWQSMPGTRSRPELPPRNLIAIASLMTEPKFTRYLNLASPRLGAEALSASDEFFAPKERMLADAPAIFVPDKYDDHGKWMDGWESRRRRDDGHDFCIVKLGCSGYIRGVDIDTSHFTGNYPPAASIDSCRSDSNPTGKTRWTEVVSPSRLGASAHHFLPVTSEEVWSHVRLNIYPDGGVARLRIYGEPVPAWDPADKKSMHELSLATNGGRIIGYNDAHYGTVWTLLTVGRGINMGDGWETRRRREPGNDWIIVKLGAPGVIEEIEIDTCHYKGNYPDSCSVQAALVDSGTDSSVIAQSMFWGELMPRKKLKMDHIHRFSGKDIAKLGPASHVKLNIFPDGGVSRLRVFGRLA
jgi:allantoicase